MRLIVRAILFVLTGLCLSLSAAAKERVTFGYLADPVYEVAVWPLRHGKVPSNLVEVDAKPLEIQASLQATAAKSYDVIMTSAAGLPLAKIRGLDLLIFATAYRAHPKGGGYDIFVKSDSPIKTLADLKGKTIGNYALAATATTHLRIALWKKHGANIAYNGGDYHWVEMPGSALPGALLSGRVDAATLLNTQAYLAESNKEFRVLIRLGKDVNDIFGGPPATAIHVTYPEKVAAKGPALREFARMLKASVDYSMSHQDEVFAAVAAETKVDPGLFRYFYGGYAQVPMAVSEADIASLDRLWALSKELGLIPSYPEAKSVVWEGAVRE